MQGIFTLTVEQEERTKEHNYEAFLMITEISLNSFDFDENRKAFSCTRSVCQMSIPTKGSGYDCEIISQAFTLCHQLKLPSAALAEQQQQQHCAWALIAREVCATDSLFLCTGSIACTQPLVTGEERHVPQVQFHYKKDIFILFRLVSCNLIWPFQRYLRNKQ